MKKVTLYVSGNVQSVGYRVKVESIARSLGIKGFVQNLPDSRVKIIAQGKQADLDKLIQNINISNSLINVTNIEQKYSNLSEDFEDFNKVVSEGETDEKLDIAIGLFKELITVNKDGFDRLGKKLGDKIDRVGEKVDHVGEKVDQVGEKVDHVSEKVDQVGKKVDHVGEKVDQVGKKVDHVGEKVDHVGEKVDHVGEKVDHVGNKTDQSRIEITSEIHSLSDDFNTLFDKRLSNIEYELAQLKDKLIVLESSSSYDLAHK